MDRNALPVPLSKRMSLIIYEDVSYDYVIKPTMDDIKRVLRITGYRDQEYEIKLNQELVNISVDMLT